MVNLLIVRVPDAVIVVGLWMTLQPIARWASQRHPFITDMDAH
jgi:hypothetical protein